MVTNYGDYFDTLKMVVGNYGYDEEEIDAFLLDDLADDEMEEYLYCG